MDKKYLWFSGSSILDCKFIQFFDYVTEDPKALLDLFIIILQARSEISIPLEISETWISEYVIPKAITKRENLIGYQQVLAQLKNPEFALRKYLKDREAVLFKMDDKAYRELKKYFVDRITIDLAFLRIIMVRNTCIKELDDLKRKLNFRYAYREGVSLIW